MKIIFIKRLIKENHTVQTLSEYVTAFDYIDKVLIVLSATSGGVGWQKMGFFVAARKLNWKFPVKTFTRFLCLTTTHKPTQPPPHPLLTHILICHLKIVNLWLRENVTKSTKVKYAIL